jgi:hypothetical protein
LKINAKKTKAMTIGKWYGDLKIKLDNLHIFVSIVSAVSELHVVKVGGLP